MNIFGKTPPAIGRHPSKVSTDRSTPSGEWEYGECRVSGEGDRPSRRIRIMYACCKGVWGWGKPGAAPSRNSVGAPGRLVAGVASITPFSRTLRTQVIRHSLNQQFALYLPTTITHHSQYPPYTSS